MIPSMTSERFLKYVTPRKDCVSFNFRWRWLIENGLVEERLIAMRWSKSVDPARNLGAATVPDPGSRITGDFWILPAGPDRSRTVGDPEGISEKGRHTCAGRTRGCADRHRAEVDY